MKIVAKTGLSLGISPLHNKDFFSAISSGGILSEDGTTLITEDGQIIIIE